MPEERDPLPKLLPELRRRELDPPDERRLLPPKPDPVALPPVLVRFVNPLFDLRDPVVRKTARFLTAAGG